MSLQICACFTKEIQNAVRLRRHKGLLYHWKLTLRAPKDANRKGFARVFSCLETLTK